MSDAVTLKDGIIFVVNIIGVGLVAQPAISIGGEVALGTFFALSSAILASFGFIIVKRMGVTVYYILIPLSIGVNGLLLSLLFMKAEEARAAWGNTNGFWTAFLGAVLGCVTQTILNKGMQVVRPGLGLVVRTFNVHMTVALGAIFLDEKVSWNVGAGVLLVIASIFAIGYSQYRNDRKATDRVQVEGEASIGYHSTKR